MLARTSVGPMPRLMAVLLGCAALVSRAAAQVTPAGPPAPVPTPAPAPAPTPEPLSFTVKPPSWDLGEVEQGRVYTMSFRIESSDPQFKVQIVRASNPFIQTQLLPMSEKDKSAWQLTCQFDIANLTGDLDEFVMLATSDKPAPLFKIPVRCKIHEVPAGDSVDGLFFYSTRVGAIPQLIERIAAIEKKRSLKIPALYTSDERNMAKQLQVEAQFKVQPGPGTQIELYCAGCPFIGAPSIDLALKALESDEKDWQKAVQGAFEQIKKAVADAQASRNGGNAGGPPPNPPAPTGDNVPTNGGGGGQKSSSPNYQTEVKVGGPVESPSGTVTAPTPKSNPPTPAAAPAHRDNPSPDGEGQPGTPLIGFGLVIVILVLFYQSFLLKEIIGRLGK